MVAQYIQSELKKHLGLEVNILTFDYKNVSKANGVTISIDVHVFLGCGLSATQITFYPFFWANLANNRTTFQDDPYDSWIIQARSLSSQKKRAELYDLAQRRMLQDYAPIIPLYYEPNLVFVRPSVEGLKMDPMNNLDLRRIQVKN